MKSELVCSVFRCRDTGVLQEDEEEEVTGSLLGGGASSPNEDDREEEKGEKDFCLPLKPAPPQRLQSTLHRINLSVQQVAPPTTSETSTPDFYAPVSPVCPSVQGKLLGVCGSVGSGKTSLMSAILGQVRSPAGSTDPTRLILVSSID